MKKEFTGQDLGGARFEECSFTGAVFHNSYFTDARLRGAWLERVDIDGELRDVTVNGVDIGPLVEAELNRRNPERAVVMAVRTSGADGFRAAWDVIEELWPPTIERARRLPADLLHEQVDGEWSFIQTLRHLAFVTDAWVRRAILSDPWPYDALDLLHTEHHDELRLPNDLDARPTLDEVLALRADRMATVRAVIHELTDESLEGTTEPVEGPGYPPTDAYPVRRCLRAAVVEEWEHHRFAERDLAVLESR